MTLTEHEAELRSNRVGALCNLINQLGQDNGSGEEYLSALTICAGLYLKNLPPDVRERDLHRFLAATRKVARSRGGPDDDV